MPSFLAIAAGPGPELLDLRRVDADRAPLYLPSAFALVDDFALPPEAEGQKALIAI
jgi:hypothetical protein